MILSGGHSFSSMAEAPPNAVAVAGDEPAAKKARNRVKKTLEELRTQQFRSYVVKFLFVPHGTEAHDKYIETGIITCLWCPALIVVAGNVSNITQHMTTDLYVTLLAGYIVFYSCLRSHIAKQAERAAKNPLDAHIKAFQIIASETPEARDARNLTERQMRAATSSM